MNEYCRNHEVACRVSVCHSVRAGGNGLTDD